MATILVLALLLSVSLGANAAQYGENRGLEMRLSMQRQREMTDIVAAMADIEVNLQKLMLASGAAQSVSLLGETALLSQHVQSGLARLPLHAAAAGDAMKFAGQMGEYVMGLAAQVSAGGMISAEDEKRIEALLAACQGLNRHLTRVEVYVQQEQEPSLYVDAPEAPMEEAISGDSGIPYPSLIYDGPFSDGRTDGPPKGLTGERITREQAREAAARFCGTTADRVRDAADSGGTFEAFGFAADTPAGVVNVQVTGVGGRLLFMMPEEAAFDMRLSREACLDSAQVYLADMGFGRMEPGFVQAYDGMLVANFIAVQDGVLLYPDQVKVQVSMESGTVVGAECSQYLMNHARRTGLMPTLSATQAKLLLSPRLAVSACRLSLIPTDAGERLCWGFEGTFAGETYFVFIDARSGETAQVLRVAKTQDGETAL